MNQTQEMLEIYGEVIAQEARQKARQEARREGELRGRVLIIEGFLGRDVPWSTIEAATGIDRSCVSPAQTPGGGRGRRHPPPRLSHPPGLSASDYPGAQARDTGKPPRFACAAGQ